MIRKEAAFLKKSLAGRAGAKNFCYFSPRNWNASGHIIESLFASFSSEKAALAVLLA
jgi:hypothetical protein